MITEARVEELLEYVAMNYKIKRSGKLPGGVVIVGGSAKLPGLADFTRDKLQLPARIGKLQDVGGLVDTVEDTSWCTPVGLMLLDMLLTPSNPVLAQKAAGMQSKMFGPADSLLKRFKR